MNILITGGTGLVGSRLTALLIAQGHTVSHLSRTPTNTNTQVKTYHWDIAKGIIDDEALLQADYLVHLAGAGIADKPWTDARKQEIIFSRTASIELIAKKLGSLKHHIKAFVSASGIGYYGADTGEERISEEYPHGHDFVATCTLAWEASADTIATLGIRTTKLRIGIVLSNQGGALPKITLPIKWGVGAALGTGKQFQSWIHIDDLCKLFIKSLFDEQMKGIYNAVAPNPATNRTLTRLSAKVLKRPLWLPNVPAFALKLVFGELACLVLGGNYVLNNRIKKETDFVYQFEDLSLALNDILSH